MFDALVRDPDELLAARADGRAPRARQRTPVPAPLPPATRGFSAGAWNWRLRRAVVVGAAGLLALSAGLTVWQRGRSETQRAAHVQVQVAPSAALAQPHVRLS